MKPFQVLNLEGQFTWLCNDKFFIETPDQCFVWSDPRKGGDNTLTEYSGTYEDILTENKISTGRDKGYHTIKDYCGSGVKVVLTQGK